MSFFAVINYDFKALKAKIMFEKEELGFKSHFPFNSFHSSKPAKFEIIGRYNYFLKTVKMKMKCNKRGGA